MTDTVTLTAKELNELISTIRKVHEGELLLQIEYLLQENKILRSKFGRRVPLTEAERRILVRYGLPVRQWLSDLMSIVRPETLLAWHRRMKRRKWDYSDRRQRSGRPRKSGDTEQLVVRLAEENSWGYGRISGEMKKLGHDLCPETVRNILIKHGLPTSLGR